MLEYGWSLDPAPWINFDKFTNLDDGYVLNWKIKPFDKFYKDSIPEKPGVYMICVKPPSNPNFPKNFYTPIYIGRASESIRSRFLYHLGSSAMPKVKKARILFSKDPDQIMFHFTKCLPEDVPTLESILIDCFGPTSNDARGIKLDEKYE